MKTLDVIHHYLVRYRNLQGEMQEGCVYASDAMEAQDLAQEFAEELRQRPNLISAVLRVA